jgi:hypothetical protein
MKKIVLIFFTVFPLHGVKDQIVKSSQKEKQQTSEQTSVAHSEKKKDFKSVDNVAVVIYTETDPIILTRSDFVRPSINGVKQKKREVILSHIMDYEAINVYKTPISDEAVTKYIGSLKEHHNLDDARLKSMFNAAGYSYEEGVDELRRMLTIDALLGFKIKSRLVVPEDEVRAYYKKHAQVEPASFKIKKGFLSESTLTEEERTQLQKIGKHSEQVDWLTPYWINEDELAESRKFIAKMQEGEIAPLEKVGNGYEVTKLVQLKKSKKRSFEESYKEISEKMKAPLFQKMLSEYHDDLLKKYEVVYL